MTHLIPREASFLGEADIQNTRQLCQMLMQTPYYAKMGIEGAFAIVETAKSLNIDLRLALGGGLYYVKGKVEMSARLMNSLIRSQKHSITQDKRSNDTVCILHGKRADNGDTWTESFSIEEAKRAGLVNNMVWKNFTKDMLFARALSRLARQLFPDVIGNAYVEGEISFDSNIFDSNIAAKEAASPSMQNKKLPTNLSNEEIAALESLIGNDDNYRQKVLCFLENNNLGRSFQDMPKEIYDKVYARALKNKQEREKVIQDTCQQGEVNQMAMGDS